MAKSFEKLIEDKDAFIDQSEEALLSNFDPIERGIYSAIKKRIMQMDQDAGSILFNETNLLILSQIEAAIIDAIQSSSYPAKITDFIASFDQVSEYNSLIQNSVNEISLKDLEQIITPIQQEVVRQTVTDLTGQGIPTTFIKPLTEGIYKNIVAGATISDLAASLEKAIMSDGERMGMFKNYVAKASRDALMQYEGQINSRIANEYELDAVRYVGSIIRDSRPQCIRWVGKGYLIKKELDAEINWAISAGSGMIPGTTKDNFCIYRGGYNCRHSAIPFKLTKSQKVALGLE